MNDPKNLSGANLSGANLTRANLSGANLSGAYFKSGIKANIFLQLLGLDYPVYFLGGAIKIGCQVHLTNEWANFSQEEIAAMDGRKALKFWGKNKPLIISMAEALEKSE